MATDHIPHIDPAGRITVIPERVRYVRVGDHFWGHAFIHNRDYVTLGFSNMNDARKEALLRGVFYPVEKWVPIQT